MVAAVSLFPLTQRALAAAMTRAGVGTPVTGPGITKWHLTALVIASGVLPGVVLSRVGWSIVAIPPLLLLVALLQLGYCDLTRRLLPRTIVHVTSLAVAISAVVVAGVAHEWERLGVASLGALSLFVLLFVMNLANPAWMAFGDVRLAPVVGLGLAWISPMALVEAFLLANVLVAVVGLSMIAAHRAQPGRGGGSGRGGLELIQSTVTSDPIVMYGQTIDADV
jgi:Flp pilus assembly protein protease CpaA